MKEIKLQEWVYKTRLQIFYDCTFKELKKSYSVINEIEDNWRCGIFVWWDWWALIWLKDKNDIPCLVHELLHFTFWAMKRRWVYYDYEYSEETFCYLQEYYLREFLKKIERLEK